MMYGLRYEVSDFYRYRQLYGSGRSMEAVKHDFIKQNRRHTEIPLKRRAYVMAKLGK